MYRAKEHIQFFTKPYDSTATGVEYICVAAEMPLEDSWWGAFQSLKTRQSFISSHAGGGVNNSSDNLRDELGQAEIWGFFSFQIFNLHSLGAASYFNCRHGSHMK